MKTIKTLLLICGLLAFCTSAMADITGSNLMLADEINTVRSIDGDTNWSDADPNSDQWDDRSDNAFRDAYDFNLGPINVSFEANSGRRTELRSTITGLTDGTRYHVWALTSLTADGARSINAAFDDGSELVTYGVGNSTDTGLLSHGDSWYLAEAYLGVAVTDESGELKVLIDWGGGERSVYHGLVYSEVLEASEPGPADGTDSIWPETDPSLEWIPTDNAGLTQHVVYMSVETGPTEEPVLVEVATLDAAVTSWNPDGANELVRDGYYYWRVDSIIDGVAVAGPVWSFSTISAYALFDASYPQDVRQDEGPDAVFTVSALNPFTDPNTSEGLSYQWYKAGSPDQLLVDDAKYTGTTTATLTVVGANAADEANYFCRTTIDSNGNEKDSPSGYLVIKRMVGHWPLDVDASDVLGNDGAAGGAMAVSYESGIVGAGCLRLDNAGLAGEEPAISYIEIAHVDAYREDVFTVSCWVKSIAPGFAADFNFYGGAVSKTDVAGEGPGWSMRRQSSGYQARWFTYGSSSQVSATNTYFMHVGEWHHLVGVYDEENNLKKLYTDGVLDQTLNDLGPDFGSMVADGTLFIGIDYVGRSPGDILIDDVKLFNYALDGFEIAQEYADVTGTDVCVEHPEMDIDGNCEVNMLDLEMFVATWLDCGIVPDCI